MKSGKKKQNDSVFIAALCLIGGIAVSLIALQFNSPYPVIFGMLIAIYGVLELMNSIAQKHPTLGKPSSMYAPIDESEYGPEYAAKKQPKPAAKEGSEFCPYCGSPVGEGFRFCRKCGKELPQ